MIPFVNRRCICGNECWCARCPDCRHTVTRHQFTSQAALDDAARHQCPLTIAPTTSGEAPGE